MNDLSGLLGGILGGENSPSADELMGLLGGLMEPETEEQQNPAAPPAPLYETYKRTQAPGEKYDQRPPPAPKTEPVYNPTVYEKAPPRPQNSASPSAVDLLGLLGGLMGPNATSTAPVAQNAGPSAVDLLGLLGGLMGPSATSTAPVAQNAGPSAVDLLGLLGGLMGPSATSTAPVAQNTAGPSAMDLLGLLGGLMGPNTTGQQGGYEPARPWRNAQPDETPPGYFDEDFSQSAYAGNDDPGFYDSANDRQNAHAPPGGLDQILQMVGHFTKDDKNIILLRALQPHLTPDRAARIEEIIKILRVLNVLPLLQDGGIMPH